MHAPEWPRFEPRAVDILNSTLGAGAHLVDFRLDEPFVVELLHRLNRTPITRIELGTGSGSEPSAGAARPRRATETCGRVYLTLTRAGATPAERIPELTDLAEFSRRRMTAVPAGAIRIIQPRAARSRSSSRGRRDPDHPADGGAA